MDVQVRVSTGGASPARDEAAARALMAELDAVPRITARLAEGAASPPGATAIEISVTEQAAGLGTAGAEIPTLFGVLRDWLQRQPPSTKLSIRDGEFELQWEGATPPQQVGQLVTRLIERQQA